MPKRTLVEDACLLNSLISATLMCCMVNFSFSQTSTIYSFREKQSSFLHWLISFCIAFRFRLCPRQSSSCHWVTLSIMDRYHWTPFSERLFTSSSGILFPQKKHLFSLCLSNINLSFECQCSFQSSDMH